MENEGERYEVFSSIITSNIKDLKDNGFAYVYNDEVLNATLDKCSDVNINVKVRTKYEKDGSLDYYTLVRMES